MLDDFPATREEMFDYDCVVAFDPDWQALSAGADRSAGELGGRAGRRADRRRRAGERRQGGRRLDRKTRPWPRSATCIRSSSTAGSAADGEHVYAAEEPWPLDFTREGLEAEFLWLADTATASRQAWAGFPGVYSCCPVRGAKPGGHGLRPLLRSARRRRAASSRSTWPGSSTARAACSTWAAAKCGGCARVDEAYFEQFYTKLIRHVSQGRLLRGSSRGVLLVGQDRYLLGNTVEVRAQLTDAQLEPLGRAERRPAGDPARRRACRRSRCGPTRAGRGPIAGQFPVLQEGAYRLELPVPESDDERLTRRIQVNMPDLERENPQRNDALLSRIAASTGGKYYVGLDAVVRSTAAGPLVEQLKDRTTTVVVPLAPNRQWEETWLRWMMFALCGLLCWSG